MASIQVNPKVFELLKQAYKEKFGGSPGSLLKKLNTVYTHEIDNTIGSSGDLISDKTLRNFFSADTPPKIQEKNLNYLCGVLLDSESYQDAVRKLGDREINMISNWSKIYHEQVLKKCSTMRVLDMTDKIMIDNIYTKVKISPTITGTERRSIDELLKAITDENHELYRISTTIKEEKFEAIEAVKTHRKLMIFGKPGAGKTTFLKYLALHFPEVQDCQQTIPVYIPLRIFAEDKDKTNLVETIAQEFAICVPNPEEVNRIVQEFLKQGKYLILLDGLDEVIEADTQRIYKAIDELTQNYPQNRFVITCRVGGSEYVPDDFKKVEIADFDREQVEKFANNWFQNRQEPEKLFLEKLEENPSVKELAISPLLLTILCWTFEDSYKFPKNRSELYAEAVDALLRRWDASRRIERDPIYKDKLSRPRKINLFSKIAYEGFTHQPYKQYWKQWEIEEKIRNFIKNIPGVELETLEIDSQAVLKGIEANHGILIEVARGIHSFSHLTFQEYFTSEYIVTSQEHEIINNVITQNLTNPQWQEIFQLIAGRLENADEFFKQIFDRANNLVKSQSLQDMLTWLDRVTVASGVSSSSWRALYLAIDLDVDLYIDPSIEINRSLAEKLSSELRNINLAKKKLISKTPKCLLELNLASIHMLASDRVLTSTSKLKSATEFTKDRLDVANNANIIPKLQSAIDIAKEINYLSLAEELEALLDNPPSEQAENSLWEQWAEDLRQVMLKHLDIGYKIVFSEEDTKALEDYLYVNNLLLDCLQGDNYSSPTLREQIVNSLLLPSHKIPVDLIPIRHQ